MVWRISPWGSRCSGGNCGGTEQGSGSRVLGAWLRTHLIIVAFLLASPAGRCVAAATSLTLGEAEYGVSWNGIPAAAATIDVRRDQDSGRPLYRVEALARTNWLVDLLWHFRGHALSSFTSDDMVPLGFRYDREENNKHIVTDVIFDPSRAGVTGKKYRGGDTAVIELQGPNLLDPITAVFRALVQPVQIGDSRRYEIFTGEARYRVELDVLGEDTVSVAAGTYRAWRIEPKVWKLGTGADERLRRATIWVSQDETRIPVRIRSEVFIGAVNCDLLRLNTGGANAS